MLVINLEDKVDEADNNIIIIKGIVNIWRIKKYYQLHLPSLLNLLTYFINGNKDSFPKEFKSNIYDLLRHLFRSVVFYFLNLYGKHMSK